jgi:hypothetical protein
MSTAGSQSTRAFWSVDKDTIRRHKKDHADELIDGKHFVVSATESTGVSNTHARQKGLKQGNDTATTPGLSPGLELQRLTREARRLYRSLYIDGDISDVCSCPACIATRSGCVRNRKGYRAASTPRRSRTRVVGTPFFSVYSEPAGCVSTRQDGKEGA